MTALLLAVLATAHADTDTDTDTDASDTPGTWSASELSGEPGGCAEAGVGAGVAALAAAVAALAARRGR